MWTQPRILFAAATVWLALAGRASSQGSLAPPGGPAPTMKTLAQIEPRVAITNTGSAVLSVPGSYYLVGNITVGAGNGITIAANNVAVDLNGFTISSLANPPAGTAVLLAGSLTNVTIENGFIHGSITNNETTVYGGSGFVRGVYYTGSQPINVRVSNLSISGCLNDGIYLNATVGNTGNTVESCLVNDCGVFGIVAEVVRDSVAYTGTGSAIFSGTASRSRGVAYSSEGLHAAQTADSCSGQSSTYYGINATVPRRCYGQSTSSTGLKASYQADTCFGQTTSGAYGLDAGIVADNSYGNHTGTGGTGLWSSQVAIGCYGASGGAGSLGIRSGILNCCIGSATGGTNTSYSFKYNMP